MQFTVKTNHGTHVVTAASVRAAKVQVINEWADVNRDFKILEVTTQEAA